MTNLFLDFETKDLAMQEGLGAGWCYKNKLYVIGYSYAIDNEPAKWSTDLNYLNILVKQSTSIICHNAQYDIGILKMLNMDYTAKEIKCTLLLSKLYNNTLHSYSLDALAHKWLGKRKLNSELGQVAGVLGLVKSKVQNADNIAKAHLDLIYNDFPHLVEKYANMDVELTRDLYNRVNSSEYSWLSDLIKCVIDVRFRGVLVSVNNIYKTKAIVDNKIAESKSKMDIFLEGKNPNSSKQLAEVCIKLGITPPTTDKGNPSFNKKSCETLDHPLFTELENYKTLQKLKTSFIDSTLESLKLIYDCSEEDLLKLKETRLHPELNIFGATATGRFSSSNPNIQQIPKHNELGKTLVRSLFIPEKNQDWYCLDFSSQEPRMQVHFSARIGSESGKLMAMEWQNNPEFDMHGYVASMMSVDRKTAKIINLGLSYGMGSKKLNIALKMPFKYTVIAGELSAPGKPLTGYYAEYPEKRPTTFPVSKSFYTMEEAEEYSRYIRSIEGLGARILEEVNPKTLKLIKLYHSKSPYLKELTDAAKAQILKNGYIKTLLGRKLYKDKSLMLEGKLQDWSYKAINKLIQGSSADQTISAMVKAYREGIKIGYPIHDEITISSNDVKEVMKLKNIMETVLKLEVPSRTEVTVGDNFANQTKLEEISEKIHG